MSYAARTVDSEPLGDSAGEAISVDDVVERTREDPSGLRIIAHVNAHTRCPRDGIGVSVDAMRRELVREGDCLIVCGNESAALAGGLSAVRVAAEKKPRMGTVSPQSERVEHGGDQCGKAIQSSENRIEVATITATTSHDTTLPSVNIRAAVQRTSIASSVREIVLGRLMIELAASTERLNQAEPRSDFGLNELLNRFMR